MGNAKKRLLNEAHERFVKAKRPSILISRFGLTDVKSGETLKKEIEENYEQNKSHRKKSRDIKRFRG